MLKPAPTLRTIALAVALSAMSTSLCALSVKASGTECAAKFKTLDACNQKRSDDDDKCTSGGNLAYLNSLKKGHHKHNCKQGGAAGFGTISDQYTTASGGNSHGYKLGSGKGAGSSTKPVSKSNQDSSSNSSAGIVGLGNFLKGKTDNGSNSKNSSGSGSIGFGFGFGSGSATDTNSNNKNSNSGSSGSGSIGFGLGSLFGGSSNGSGNGTNGSTNNSQTSSASGSIGFGLGNLFGQNSGSNTNSNSNSNSSSGSSSNSNSGLLSGSTSGSNSTSGNTSGTGTGTGTGSASGTGLGLLPSPGTGSNPNSNSNNPVKLPNILKPLKPVPVKPADLPIITDQYTSGRQTDYTEYQKRLQRWAATGSTQAGGGSGSTIIPRVTPIVGGGTAAGGGAGGGSGSSAGGGGGGGGSAGAGQGFLPNTSGQFMQQMWNSMNQKSATCDASQQRQPEGSNPNSVYMSLPSADRTMRQPFIVPMNGQSEDKKNCPGGGPCANKGDEGNYNQLQPQEPPQEVTTGGNAKAQDFVGEQFVQNMMSPDAQAKMAAAGAQSCAQGAGEACAAGTCEGLEQALMVMFLPTATVNVANEASGTPGSTLTPFRPLSQAIWMVQRMYKQVFMPMALLLLLPGAVILNIKVMLHSGINHGADEDTTSPFSAIMRSMIAVFLIPATQLIVSYASDIGSAMTHEVSGATKVMALVAWAKTAMGESMTPLNGEATGISNMDSGRALFRAVMHTVSMTLAYGLLMLIAFQITIMCYLMCMGPIAAAFYVYPTGVGRLFKPVFANWVDAVINIALWKFWWCVIVLCMVTRINIMTFVDINPEWEAYMFVCFLVMMSYVPFAPFECKPGEMVDKILQKAQELKKEAGGQGG